MKMKLKTKQSILAILCLAAIALPCPGQQSGLAMVANSAQPVKSAKPKTADTDSERKFEIGLEIFQKLNVAARRDGFLASAKLAPGTIVSKGEVLATLDVERTMLEIKRLQAEVQASQLRNHELAKAAQLTRIPQLELVEARTNLTTKTAELQLAELELKESKIIAPFDGVVFKQHKHVGEAVSTSQPLAEIYRLDYLLGTVLLDQNEIAPEEFLRLSGKVKIDLPRKGLATYAFRRPTTLPRIERDGRYLAVIMIRNRKTKQGDAWELLPGMRGSLVTVDLTEE